MPWTKADVDKFNKGLSSKQKEQWVAVANAALKKCQDAGNDDCDAAAIKQANAAVRDTAKSEAANIVSEIGKMISSANMKTIQTAMEQMTAAMQLIAQLVGEDDAKEEGRQEEKGILESIELKISEATAILAQDDSYDSSREKVAAALRKRAAALRQTFDPDEYYYTGYIYVCSMYDNYVVYEQKGKLYQCEYSINGDVVTLGDPTEVKLSYVPVSNSTPGYSESLKSGIIPLIEKAVRDDGKARIKLISPGWGSSGYYSEEMLKRDGPKVFTKGLHMFINHQTENEANERPEGDLKDLAGVIESEVTWEDNPQTGPGLYADATVFNGWRQFVDEAAPHIGVSIRAGGKVSEGEAEGRRGFIIDELSEGYSVDYVTLPGRGGAVLPLLESARKRQSQPTTITEVGKVVENKENQVNEEEIKALKESHAETTKALSETQTELARMREAMILRDTRDIVKETLATLEVPDMTKARLLESLSKNPPVKDGVLDTTTLVESVKSAAIAEMQYLEAAAGSAPKPTGVGTTTTVELSEEDANKALKESMILLGMSETAAEIATRGRK